jgi:hypothetical protein
MHLSFISVVQGLRNRASRSGLVKLYKHMSKDRLKMVQTVKLGGLLQTCHTIPKNFATLLIRECFDAET